MCGCVCVEKKNKGFLQPDCIFLTTDINKIFAISFFSSQAGGGERSKYVKYAAVILELSHQHSVLERLSITATPQLLPTLKPKRAAQNQKCLRNSGIYVLTRSSSFLSLGSGAYVYGTNDRYDGKNKKPLIKIFLLRKMVERKRLNWGGRRHWF